MTSDTLPRLLKDIRACVHCAAVLPCGPRPVVQAHRSARLRIVGQAPGRKVHETGIPWNDASGARLRGWLGMEPAPFYDPRRVALIGMGFCYPGKGPSGDNPPRPECAPRWHDKLNAHLPNIALTLLVGHYAQAYYLGARRKPTLGDTVKAWRDYLPSGCIPLVHPSPRNQGWLVRNPWFEAELVAELRDMVRGLGL
jgi:uracil-DNA glycosylase